MLRGGHGVLIPSKAKTGGWTSGLLFHHASGTPHPAQGGMCLPYRDGRVKPGRNETVTKH
jgi:hypothetical protein